MVLFDPPVGERDDMELIEIVRISPGDWLPEVVVQASEELQRRGITPQMQQKIVDDYHGFLQRLELEEARQRGLNALQKYPLRKVILMFFGAPYIILRPYGGFFSEFRRLRQENYKIKFRQRAYALLAGLFFWIIVGLWQIEIGQQQRLQEIEKAGENLNGRIEDYR